MYFLLYILFEKKNDDQNKSKYNLFQYTSASISKSVNTLPGNSLNKTRNSWKWKENTYNQ